MILFLLLALLGFVASVVVHASTFAAMPPLGMHEAWPLHIGIFIVFLPMVLSQQRNRQLDRPKRAKAGTMDDLLRDAPRWMRQFTTICFTYAIVNFVVFMGSQFVRERDGKISTVDGRHVVRNHGAVVRTLSEQEFRVHEARIARGFSGHWMIFYWASFVGIYDGLRRRRAARLSLPLPPALPQNLRQTRTYERPPTPRLSPWLHATLGAVLSFVCFFAVPFLLITTLKLLAPPDAPRTAGGGWFCLIAPLFFGGAIFGFSLPGRLMARHVPAACPMCGGRAYASGPALNTSNEDIHYTCRDCAYACGVDGAGVG
jgi:hypothetical protein